MAGKMRSVKLKSVTDVNRFLAKLVNQVNREEVDDRKAARMGYLCSLMTKSFVYEEMELRIEKIERQLKKLEKAANETDEKIGGPISNLGRALSRTVDS